MARRKNDPEIAASAAEVLGDDRAEQDSSTVRAARVIATGDDNETVTADEAAGRVTAPKTNGPRVGDRGEYKPAVYKTGKAGGRITRIDC